MMGRTGKRPAIFENFARTVKFRFDGSLRKLIVMRSHMSLLRSTTLSVVASFVLLAVAFAAEAQVTAGEQNVHLAGTPSRVDAVSLQRKAAQAQARIHANKNDRGALMRAVKTNEVPLAKEVLLRNGFTAEDLENAKISLRTGGGKGSEDGIEITASCCDPKEITIQRSLDYFTK
jgi:hypothetical protein